VTDLGNLVIDVEFGVIEDAQLLEQRINSLPGVVNNSLFLGLVDEVVVSLIEKGQAHVNRQSYIRSKS
jgi:ribose 5-phosphate isomerase A